MRNPARPNVHGGTLALIRFSSYVGGILGIMEKKMETTI